MIFVGIAAFALLFASDVNDAFFGRRGLRFLFPLGFALLAGALGVSAFLGQGQIPGPGLCALYGTAALVCIAGLVYALFFALPAQASYGEPGQTRAVCDTGLYALCRHPGVLIFVFLMLFLWLGTRLRLIEAGTYVVLNIALAVFEDTAVFPRRLKGYAEYRRRTPFMIPIPAAVRTAIFGRR